ncbi:hypothetical protein ACIQUQ_33205, partial [Streptomyces sp. NPDC101118]|uniref:hypothetical protein n=1 Tax=Streptomyces sp. NPDC101118 TaxID=3366109 RepID=UPI0038066104
GGLPLARVGTTIAPDTSGWYVRPDTLASRHGAQQLTVRHVHHGTYRPATPTQGKALRDLAAEPFTSTRWTVANGPVTVLTVQAPTEDPRFARTTAERDQLLAELRAAAADTPAHAAYLDQLTTHYETTGTDHGAPEGDTIEGLDGYWSSVLWCEARTIYTPARRGVTAYSANYRRLRNLKHNPALTVHTLAVPPQITDHIHDTDDPHIRAALTTATRKGHTTYLTAPLWLHKDILDLTVIKDVHVLCPAPWTARPPSACCRSAAHAERQRSAACVSPAWSPS